ncbi:MAG: serine hydrolase domain-containing protein [Woeseia sp.]
MKKIMVSMFFLALVACGNEEADVHQEARETASRGLIDPARIDSALSGFVERGELVGVSALVYEGGAEAYFGAFGMADREAERPMRRDALVQIYSMTKPVTGVVLMTLYEERLFKLDDPLEKYLPEFTGIKVYAGEDNGEPRFEAPGRPPTVRDILRHTAGFASGSTGDEGNDAWVNDRYREVNPTNVENTLEQFSVKLASVPLLFDPGTRWLYGPSVDVQARLAEVLSGKPYDVLLQERVLDPLGMTETQYTLRPEQRDRISALYERHPDGSFMRMPDDESLAFNFRDWPMTPGSWGLTSTLDDYMKFARMLLDGGEFDGVRILQPETIRLMATDAMPAEVTDKSWLPNKGQVGFGIDFAVRVAPPGDQAEASGAVGEFFWDGAANTLFWVDPENDVAAVLFNFYRPFGKVEIQKDFRDAVYYRDATASALKKALPGPDSRRLSD